MTTDFAEADGCYQLQHVELKDILNAPSMDISLRTATEAGDYMSNNNTHINDTRDQMLAIEQTPEGPGSGAAMKILDHNRGRQGVNRYD